MNKRIKQKHATHENKTIMTNTLNYLKSLGLTPFNIEFPKGYFVFRNKNSYEIMHFQLKEIPEFLFGVWYKDIYLYDDIYDENLVKIIKQPIIFGERICILDKFKPSRAEWSPLDKNFISKGLEYSLKDYYNTLDSLKDFVKAPWNHLAFETEAEYKQLLENEKLKDVQINDVLQILYKNIEDKFRELNIPMAILVKDPYWSHNNLYLFFEKNTESEKIEDAMWQLHEYLQFDMIDDVKEILESLNYTETVYHYDEAFDWRSQYYWLTSKDMLNKAKTMSFMDLNKEFKDLKLKGSNFVRLIAK